MPRGRRMFSSPRHEPDPCSTTRACGSTPWSTAIATSSRSPMRERWTRHRRSSWRREGPTAAATRPPRASGVPGRPRRCRARSRTATAPATRSRPRSPSGWPRASIRPPRWRSPPGREESASPAAARTSGSSPRTLSDHLLGSLVVPQAEVARVAQPPVPRPLAECELPDQAWLDPMGSLRDRMDVDEWGVRSLQLPHPLAEVGERPLVETGADLAGVAELAVLVVADEERPEVGALAMRRGEAPDHELLLMRALQLQPVRGAGARVAALGPLGDQPLEAAPAGVLEQGLAVAVAMGEKADVVLEVESRADQLLPGSVRKPSGVVAVEVEDVEEVEVDRDAGPARAHRVCDVHSSLEPREARDVPAEGDDLPVDDEIRGGLGPQRLDQLRVGVVERLVVAGEQSHSLRRAEGEAPDSV